jgi:hypothetical protein
MRSSHEPGVARCECSDDSMTGALLCFVVYLRCLDLGELHVITMRDLRAVWNCRIDSMRS